MATQCNHENKAKTSQKHYQIIFFNKIGFCDPFLKIKL